MFIRYKKYKNGGEILIHAKVNRNQADYKDLLTIAIFFAKKGKSVKLTPPIHIKSVEYFEIYGSLIGTIYERKCPDLKIGDLFYEYERFIRVSSKTLWLDMILGKNLIRFFLFHSKKYYICIVL